MKRLANHIAYARLALALGNKKKLAHQLKQILAQSSAISTRPARDDIDDNLVDPAAPPKRTQKRDVFTQLNQLIQDLNRAPPEIRNAPETNSLIRKIFVLMSDAA